MTHGLRAALLGLLAAAASLAWAHQQKEAVTRVLFNPRTGNIEVMHRFLLHDAEHAVKLLRKAPANMEASAEDRDYFAAYVNRQFSLHDAEDQPLTLVPVGHEIEGRFLWVYAETPIPASLSALIIRHDALRGIWPEQVNLVNVERDGRVSSLMLSGTMQSSVIRLDERD